jgi:hypothetical protein
VATGYTRTAYQKILKGTRTLLPESHHGDAFPVGIDYGVMFDMEKGKRGAGMRLQGCIEATHGVSVINFYQPLLLYSFRDLSYGILDRTNKCTVERYSAAGEIVKSIFEDDPVRGSE